MGTKAPKEGRLKVDPYQARLNAAHFATRNARIPGECSWAICIGLKGVCVADTVPTRMRYLWLGMTFTASAAASQLPGGSLADLSLEELSNIQVVSASKRAQALSDAAASLFVITADDIRRSGATSLPEALRLAPNLTVAQFSNTGWSVSARGFNNTANKLLVLIDGRSIYTPLFAGVFWDIQDVMLEDVERIEVISGPGGTLWGVNAVNGVINVITRSSKDTQGTLLSASGGNRGIDLGARHGSTINDDATYRLYARHFTRDRSHLANGSDVDDAWQMDEAGFRSDWQGAADRLMMEGQVQQGDHGQPAPGSISINGVPFTLGDIRTRTAHVLARWVRRLHDDGELSVQGYVDHSERVVPPTFSEKLDIADLQWQYALPRSGAQAWVVGGEYRVSWDRLDNSSYFGFLPADLSQTWASLFAQDEVTLRPDLNLTLGARLESNDYTGVEWLPNIRLAWKPQTEQLLWTALSRTVRAPSRLDRDPYVPWPSTVPWPPSLGPQPTYALGGGPEAPSEVAHVLELGYRGQPTAQTSLSMTVYRALYDGLHTQEVRQSAMTYYVFEGNMKGAVDGLEVWGSYQPLPTWRLMAGFSGLYQRFALKPDSTDQTRLAAARGQDPAQTWLLRSYWDLPGNTELNMAVRHVSVLQTPDVPAYLALDVRYAWRMRPGLEWALTGRNVLGSGHGEYTAMATRAEIGPAWAVQLVTQF